MSKPPAKIKHLHRRLAAVQVPTVISLIMYGKEPNDLTEMVLTDLSGVEKMRADHPDRVLWIDVDGPCAPEMMVEFGRIFKLHQLALEDVVNTHQRAKFEEYKEHFFAVSRMVSIEDDYVDTEQLSVFVSKNFVLTFQQKPGGDCLGPVRERIQRGQGLIRDYGADHLAYSLMDAVIDAYFPVLTGIEDILEELEDKLDDHHYKSPSRDITRRIHILRRDILKLRRVAMPMRDMVYAMSRNARNVSEETRIHMRDCYDHTVQILDLIETHRDTCVGLRELYQSGLSNHSNEVMKFLTIVTTVFTPLTFIAGIYGMNFNTEKSRWNMPELNWALGYPFALLLMSAVGAGLLFFLYRRGWIDRRAFSATPVRNDYGRIGMRRAAADDGDNDDDDE